MRVSLLRGTGVVVLLWFAFLAAASRVRAGTVALERCLRPEPEWPEETGVPMGAASNLREARAADAARDAADRIMPDDDAPWSRESGASASPLPPERAAANSAVMIPLPAPLLSGSVGLAVVATALLLRRVRRA